MTFAIWCCVVVCITGMWCTNSVEIIWISLLNLNIWLCWVIVILNCLHLLLLQMRREIILLLVIKIVNSSYFLISIFGILLWTFAVLSQYQGFIHITRNGIRLRKTILPKMSSSHRHNRLRNFWHLLRKSLVLHYAQVILHGTWVVAISNLILIFE